MIDHHARAKKAWPILAKRANKGGEPFAYIELCNELDLHYRAAAHFLGVIQEYCKVEGLPPLQALAVNKRTRLPGSGYYGSKINKKSHLKALDKVREIKWPIRAPKSFI